jgi:hypothetical protein
MATALQHMAGQVLSTCSLVCFTKAAFLSTQASLYHNSKNVDLKSHVKPTLHTGLAMRIEGQNRTVMQELLHLVNRALVT